MYNVTLIYNDNEITNSTTTDYIKYTNLNTQTLYTVVIVPINNAGAGRPANVTVTTLTPSGM